MTMNSERVWVFDTTLRDGEQSPGASLTSEQKLEIALQLERLRVDVMEAGFPISSPDDRQAVNLVSRHVRDCGVAGLCRCRREDIDCAAEALRPARHPRIHVFIATSDLHMRHKLRMTREQVVEAAVEAVRYARRKVADVEFSCEDAARSDHDFLCRVVEAVIAAGARTVNIPDTVGYSVPGEFGALIRMLRERVPNSAHAVFSVHCHNDLGLGVANSIDAVRNGARQVECTINGIGERAGNASLEEIVMILCTRPDVFRGMGTRINTRELYPTSRLVSSLTGIVVQPNKAVVGQNAFRHEAGIHQDGILKDRRTYEIMSAESVGVPSSELVLGKHSGRHALAKRLASLGYRIAAGHMDRVFAQFKQLCDKKKHVFDEDLVALVGEELGGTKGMFSLRYFHTSSGSGVIPTATVELEISEKGKLRCVRRASFGDGPIDAAYRAIDEIVAQTLRLREAPRLTDYALKAVSSGKDAQGEVVVKLEHARCSFSGRGLSTDVVEASIKAYVAALNNFVVRRRGIAVRRVGARS
jgi:2-isopropylmalate synthase